ncbi:ankyrin repeat domain-containing protein [Wolbachia endosymbiont of Onchocerca volvulus]|uniref:ankyrin repeat domain-containing protein n=1 Tax=Onchocerca volvulus endobacterium TaxID=77551 RepID=UPI00046D1068|nr:ankyrin repeat domain-containing protein [Wolbachia endosymbiont of Onchocerca volvulus]
MVYAQLHKANYNNDTKVVRLLFKLKVNVNVVTKCNRTPLLLAFKKSSYKNCKNIIGSWTQYKYL